MLRTDLQIRKWKPASSGERKACGESLYIRCWNDGTKSFELRAQKQFVILGHYPALNLSAARHLTITSRSLLKDGIIPIEKLKLLMPRVQTHMKYLLVKVHRSSSDATQRLTLANPKHTSSHQVIQEISLFDGGSWDN